MATILIHDVEEMTLQKLRDHALTHGRTPEAEAKAILEEHLAAPVDPAWNQVNAFRHQLAESGRSFGNSAELLREDRDR